MHRRHLLALVAVALGAAALVFVALLGVGVLGDVLPGGPAQSDDSAGDRPLHEHPEEAGESGDQPTPGGLSLLVGTSLEESAVQLSEGQYEQAREALGGNRSDLDGLAAAAIDADGSGDIATAYDRLRSIQRALASEREAYGETLAAYQQARDTGEETAARQRARELGEHLDRIEQLHAAALDGYTHLANVTDYDFTRAIERTNETVAGTRSAVEAIREETFVETTLSVEAEATTISYDDPLELSGQLLDAGGEPVAGGEIAVADPAGATTATTDENGSFEMTHWPVLLSTAAGLTVTFRPESAGPYRASEAAMNVTVEQVEGALSVDGLPDEVAFGDDIAVTVEATVGGERVAGVPVELRVGNSTARGVTASNVTGANGTTGLSTTLPPGVPAGEQSVTVTVPGDEPAVAFGSVTRPITVRETATTLDLQGERTSGDTVDLSGRLETAEGTPLPNQSVVLSLAGDETVEAVTDDGGQYSLTVEDAPSAAFEAVATHAAVGTNLQSAGATANVTAGAATGRDGPVPGLDAVTTAIGEDPTVALAGVGLAGLLALAGGVAFLFGRSEPDERHSHGGDDGATAPAWDPQERLRAARTRTRQHPGAATTLAYLVARRELDATVDGPTAATHREFLDACASAGIDDGTLADLATLTRCHERAAFGPDRTDQSTAETAVETAERIVG